MRRSNTLWITLHGSASPRTQPYDILLGPVSRMCAWARITCTADHLPPFGAGTPLALRPSAIWLRLAPSARNRATIGATSLAVTSLVVTNLTPERAHAWPYPPSPRAPPRHIRGLSWLAAQWCSGQRSLFTMAPEPTLNSVHYPPYQP